MRRKSTSLCRMLLMLALLVFATAAAMASVPNAPMGLRYFIGADQGGQRYIYLEWASGDSTRQTSFPYHVYQGVGGGGAVTFAQIATVPDSGSHGFYMVTPDPGTYTFYVTAFNNDGESAPSNYVTVNLTALQIIFDATTLRSTGQIGQPFSYTSQARIVGVDSSLTYEIVNPLPGMTIGSKSGFFSWTPDRIGMTTVKVRAYFADEPSIEAFQTLYLDVRGDSVRRCATITGTVGYTNGNPVTDGLVIAWPVDSLHFAMQRSTISNGHYSISVQDSVAYRVQLVAGRDYAQQWAPQTVALLCGAMEEVDFSVEKLLPPNDRYDSATGRVRLRADGSPVMAIVTALDSNGRIIGTARTDQNGFYGLVFKSAGPFYVHAVPVDSSILDQYYDHSATRNGAILLYPPDYHGNVDFDLDRRVVYQNSISGTLISKTNDLIDGIVTAYAIAQRSGHVVIEYAGQTPTNAGSFSISNLLPGTYVLFAIPRDSSTSMPGYYREHHKAERDWQDATQLTIDANTTLTGIEIKLDKADGKKGHGRVHGTISGEAGTAKHNGNAVQGVSPLAGANVYAVDAQGLASGWAVTDQNGAYQIIGLGSGTYTIQVDHIGFKGSQIVVNVDEDQSVGSAPGVTLSPAESVSGVPVAGASIASMRAYPNPARDGFTLGFTAQRGEAVVKMTDVAGFEVLSRTITTVDGANTIALQTGSLGSGIYFVTVTSQRGVVSVPVTVVR